MAKKIDGYIKLQILLVRQTKSFVGPALVKSVNIMEFVKLLMLQLRSRASMPIPVTITVYQDKSFTYETKSFPVIFY